MVIHLYIDINLDYHGYKVTNSHSVLETPSGYIKRRMPVQSGLFKLVELSRIFTNMMKPSALRSGFVVAISASVAIAGQLMTPAHSAPEASNNGAHPTRTSVRNSHGAYQRLTLNKKVYNPPCVPNRLLITPNKDGQTDLMQTLREVNGHVVHTIGRGELMIWVVEFDQTDEFVKAEKKLVNDKHAKRVQRDVLFKTQAYSIEGKKPPPVGPDPYQPNEWYLTALNVLNAWNRSTGSNNWVGVIDSGTDSKNKDLLGKVDPGYDAVKFKTPGKDVNGHGTMCSTCIAATYNNALGTVGPARNAQIFGVRSGFHDGSVSISAMVEGIYQVGARGIKLINLSVNGYPSTLSDDTNPYHVTFHDYCKWFHGNTAPVGFPPSPKGMIFNAAGNEGGYDDANFHDYFIPVAAQDPDLTYAYFSNYNAVNTGGSGPGVHTGPIWFCGPGVDIVCTTRHTKVVSVAGTSFASPLCCSVAALIWGANPSLTNTQVENCMKAHSNNFGDPQNYGYWGMPDANACLQALGF